MKTSYRVTMVACLPIFYVLSVGPAYWLHSKLDRDTKAWSAFAATVYAPLIWVDQHSLAFHKAIEWYAGLWDPHD